MERMHILMEIIKRITGQCLQAHQSKKVIKQEHAINLYTTVMFCMIPMVTVT